MAIQEHFISAEGGDLPLTVARASGAGAALVILPSAFGVGADLIAQMEALATSARLVVAVDPFFRSDAGFIPYDDMAHVMKRMQALDVARSHRDFRAALAWARAEAGGQRVIALGICFGGPYALLAAADGAVDGVVTWHGTRMEDHVARAAEMRCPMRLHFGGVDPFVPAKAVDALRHAFAGRGDVRFFVHPGATHGFSHRAAANAYHAPAERTALASLRELVEELA